MTKTELTFETLKLIVSLLTPLLVLLFGFIISKKVEKNKLKILKEKEWHVKWAELFFNQATEFNNNITKVICILFDLQDEKDQSKVEEILKNLSKNYSRISEIDWNIQNYTQFSKTNGKEVIRTQKKLMDSIRHLTIEKKGNLETIRKLQFEYNDAVRKAHNEILKIK